MQLKVNGIDTFIACGGRDFDPSLPTVVMLHGAGFDSSTWSLHSRWFAHHGYNLLAPDLPGHGHSGGKPLATIAELRVFEPLPYLLTLDGEERGLEAMLVAVGNGPSFGGGLRITEGAEIDDGLLDVVVIKPVSKVELVRTYPKLFRGTHVHHPQYERHRVRKVTVAAPGIVAYADGERIGALPLTIECVPAAARVIA